MKKILLFFVGLSVAMLGVISCEKEKETQHATGSIYGCITDFATGNPIHNANIQLRPTGETTLTGSDGLYEFLHIKDGDYYITISKAEYGELIDPHVIEVKNGRRVRRDVQIEKQPTYIRFTDVYGKDIPDLDFGTTLNMMAFNIYNNGTVSISCEVRYSSDCQWIQSVSDISGTIKAGDYVTVSVTINRSKLGPGENIANLYITSNNGSNVIQLKATSADGNPPVVQISAVTDITPSSGRCTGQVTNENGGVVSDCGFCYGTSPKPSLSNTVVRLGSHTGSFSYTLTNLKQGVTYYVRAFATSNLGTGYSSDVSFTTSSGMPICGSTTISHLDPTTVKGTSTATCGSNSTISEKGFCWSISSNPTINNNKVVCGFGNGDFSGYISSLQPSTTYYVRSYATNEYGTAYGPELSLVSHSGLATVSTSSAYKFGDYIITGGNVTDDAGTVVIDRGVCYGFSHNPNLSWNFEHTYDGDGTGEFTSHIPLPTSSGYLYIRAYATTKYGTSYGNEVSIYVY